MEFNNIEDIVKDLRSKYGSAAKGDNQQGAQEQKVDRSSLFPTSGSGFTGIEQRASKNEAGVEVFRPLDYTVDPNAIYDRLSDGSYVAKFENYLGETGNEDRLARTQSASEQWWNGVQKFGRKAGNYALDATVGTVYGIFNGLSEGDMRGVWDNDFSNWMDDVNKTLDYNLPNYYTDEQKSMGILESMGTANFWANDVGGGLAFVAGALIPEALIALGTGGASVPVSLAKAGFRGATKAIGKKAVKESMEQLAKKTGSAVHTASKFNRAENASNSVKALQIANFGKSFGDALNTGRFLIQSSNFEAGMEARHNFHESIDTFMTDFESKNGREATYQEIQEFTTDAVSAANYVYGANMAILSVSNAAMFGKTFNIAPGLATRANNFGNKLIGLGVKRGKGGALALQESNRLQRVAGKTYKILSKPATEGLYEEGLQGVAGTTMQNYLESKYDPDIEDAYGMWSSFTDAMAHQYGTKEGWKEMGIGMIIGFGAPLMQKQAPPGFMSDSYKSKRKALEGQVSKSNVARTNILSRMNDATAISNISSKMQSKVKNGEDASVDNILINAQYIKSSEAFRSEGQMKADYEAIVDNMEMTEDQIAEIGAENIEAYKSNLKSDFKKDLKNHRFASKSVESLGLDRTLKDTPANVAEIGDAVYMSIMTGKGALNRNRVLASQIDAMIGSEGVFNHLEHFGNLSKEEKEKVGELKKKKRQLKAATDRANKYGRELAGFNTGLGREFTDETKKARQNKASEKRVIAQQEVNKLNEEIDRISEDLGQTKLRTESLDLAQTVSTDSNSHDIVKIVEELDKLQDFAKSLQNSGRTQDYEVLMGLIEDFKMNSDTHREMNNMVRKMYDTNFFTTKEGKGFRKMVTGKPYELTDDFRKIIRKNDATIDKSLKMVGYRNTGKSVEELIEDLLGPENDNLSDREKFRLESLIRMQLGYRKLSDRLEKITEEAKIPEAKKDAPLNPIEGDTIALARKLGADGQDLGSIKVLDGLIAQITAELDKLNLKVGKVNQEKIDSLKAKIEELEAKRDEITKESKPKVVTPLEEVSEEEYKAFVDDKIVSEERLEDIANKLKEDPSGNNLSKEEKAIRRGNSKEIEALMKSPTEELDTEISKLKQELDVAKRTTLIKMVDSEEYRRLEALNKKKAKEGVTEEEQIEIDELEEDIDQWITISGIVAEGLRLSELLEQRSVLKNTTIEPLEDVGSTTSQETLDAADIKDKTSKVYASIGQTYDSVIAVGSEMKDGSPAVEVSGITPEVLAEEVGFDFEFERTEQNTILISPETQEKINSQSPISILPTNKDLSTNYSVVLKTTIDKEGNSVTEPLLSKFGEEFSSPMVPQEIYNSFVGEEISLEVDASDKYNKEVLIPAYKKAKSKADKKKALDEIRKRLVIKVINSKGDFVSLLKSKRSEGNKNDDYNKLASIRDRIVGNDEILEDLLSGGVISGKELGIEKITVKKIFPGHPNFNLTRESDGSVTIDSKSLTAQDIEKVDDVGYLQNGEPKTREKRGGIDLTFMGKKVKDENGTKFPFIVLNVGATRVAYPVSIAEDNIGGLEEFEAIYKAKTNAVDKANSLNKFMASKGLDIKIQGNAFIAIGKDNLNDEFFSKKVADLNSIQYFRSLEGWANNSSSIESILGVGVSVDINLSKPLHSPKMQLDFSEIKGAVTITEEDKPQASVSKTAGKGASKLSARIKQSKTKKCKK